jgi:uncharacterized damage-inducible protein DinB
MAWLVASFIMIDAAYVRMMTRYNRWQNGSLYAAASNLSEEERRQDRGAFFKSIHATLNHLLWADRLWMSRLADLPKPAGGIFESTRHVDDWVQLRQERAIFDECLIDWSAKLDSEMICGDLAWQSVSLKSQVKRPRSTAIVHMFNHQTHHRGQVHAMLTAAGTSPSVTDLIIMQE